MSVLSEQGSSIAFDAVQDLDHPYFVVYSYLLCVSQRQTRECVLGEQRQGEVWALIPEC